MITLLIVDDEQLITEYLKTVFEWSALGISRILCAYSMQEAQNMLSIESIELVICDIEMPVGSGLELLEWMREMNMHTQVIILTAHARFDYAKRALKLGSFDYVLKPIVREDLQHIVDKAVRLIKAQETSTESRIRNHDFWRGALKLHEHYEQADIAQLAARYNTRLPQGENILTLLALDEIPLSTIPIEDAEWIATSAMKQNLSLVCHPFSFEGYIVMISEVTQIPPSKHDDFTSNMRSFMELARTERNISFSLFVGERTSVERIYRQFDMLVYLAKQSVIPLSLKDVAVNKDWNPSYERPGFQAWEAYLENCDFSGLYQLVEAHIHDLIIHDSINTYVLSRFEQDFLQMIYSFLQKKKIQANEFIDGVQSALMAQDATKSLFAYRRWIDYVFRKLEQLPIRAATEQTGSLISVVKRYVDENIANELSRSEIASFVSVSPEHLSRVFHKEEGITLQKYIQKKKLDEACRLLVRTDQSIAEIAQCLGFNNFAYFSQYFKKAIGILPFQYRRNHRKKRNFSQ